MFLNLPRFLIEFAEQLADLLDQWMQCQKVFPLIVILHVLLIGCSSSNIWNAGDLTKWVKQQAVERYGLAPGSIELEQWYREEDGAKVWQGHGKDLETGELKNFEINVDKVWKPSSEG